MIGVIDELAIILGRGVGGRISLGCFAVGGNGGGFAFGASLASYGEGLGFRWRGII